MNSNIPFQTIDWSKIEKTIHPGETGTAFWQTAQFPGLRIRIVEYTAGYLADHWCARGHVIHILMGEMMSELKDWSKTFMKEGMTYLMSDNPENPHRSFTEKGVRLFIAD